MNVRGYFHPYSSVETVEVFLVNISKLQGIESCIVQDAVLLVCSLFVCYYSNLSVAENFEDGVCD